MSTVKVLLRNLLSLLGLPKALLKTRFHNNSSRSNRKGNRKGSRISRYLDSNPSLHSRIQPLERSRKRNH